MSINVKVSIGEANYRVKAVSRNHTWYSDEPEEHNGSDTGPTPTELLLISLGSCTLITLKMYLERKEWRVKKIIASLSITKKTVEGVVHSVIERKIEISGDLDDEKKTRLLQIANACPVHKLLTGEITINTSLDS